MFIDSITIFRLIYGSYCNLLRLGNCRANLTFYWPPRTLEHGVDGVCVRINGIPCSVISLIILLVLSVQWRF